MHRNQTMLLGRRAASGTRASQRKKKFFLMRDKVQERESIASKKKVFFSSVASSRQCLQRIVENACPAWKAEPQTRCGARKIFFFLFASIFVAKTRAACRSMHLGLAPFLISKDSEKKKILSIDKNKRGMLSKHQKQVLCSCIDLGKHRCMCITTKKKALTNST